MIVATQNEHTVTFSTNPSEIDVEFASAQCKCTLVEMKLSGNHLNHAETQKSRGWGCILWSKLLTHSSAWYIHIYRQPEIIKFVGGSSKATLVVA